MKHLRRTALAPNIKSSKLYFGNSFQFISNFNKLFLSLFTALNSVFHMFWLKALQLILVLLFSRRKLLSHFLCQLHLLCYCYPLISLQLHLHYSHRTRTYLTSLTCCRFYQPLSLFLAPSPRILVQLLGFEDPLLSPVPFRACISTTWFSYTIYIESNRFILFLFCLEFFSHFYEVLLCNPCNPSELHNLQCSMLVCPPVLQELNDRDFDHKPSSSTILSTTSFVHLFWTRI